MTTQELADFLGCSQTEPRYSPLSADQITKVFLGRGWQKDLYRAMCDNAEADGLLAQIKGDGRGG